MIVSRDRSAGSAPALMTKMIGWCAFLAGLAVAGVGIGLLRVELAVGGLIVASTSGLILLRFRAQSLGRIDGAENADVPAQPMVGTTAA